MGKIPVFDAHCDTIWRCLRTGEGLYRNSGMVSLEKTERALDRYCQFFALFSTGEDVEEQYRRLLACFREQMAQNSGHIVQCRTAEDAEAAHSAGKAAAFLSVEGAELLGCDPARLDEAAAEGVVAVNLTWNRANALSGSHCDCPERGLTPLGKRFLARMGELHILPDVSHLSEAGFWDVMELAAGPVIASHSDAKFVWGHTRNLTNEQITAIIKNQGVIGLNFYTEFVGGSLDLDAAEAHLEHILSLGGERCAALGGDWDGCETIAALPSVDCLGRLYEHLLRHNYRETTLNDVFYNNLMRVVSQR